MGNISSTQSSTDFKFENFYEIIDYIATYYILTSDFNSLRKLTDKEYCDKLIILTSDIIKRYFTDLEVTYLAQRIKDGIEVNDLTKDNIIFLNKEQLEDLDVQNDYQKSIRKKRVCLGIAKFYIKIAHLFAAIVMTINPIYSFKDSDGNTVKVNLYEKDKIPKNTPRKVTKLNICDNRIKSLMPQDDFNDPESEYAKINPKLCSINIDEQGNDKFLNNEPGIPELMQLYLDDKYDYATGTFLGMSDETKSQYEKDLKNFYKIFTGNDEMPDNIKSFGDIKLKDYNKKIGCQGVDPLFKKKYRLSKNDKLFVQYADNIKNMINSASSKQKELLSIINDIFSYVNDPYTGKRKIRVNPKLTENILQKGIEKARNIIIQLYLKCEQDYVNGIKIYEAIIESKILETTQNQIKSLEKQAINIIKESNQTMKIIPPKNEVIDSQPTEQPEEQTLEQPQEPSVEQPQEPSAEQPQEPSAEQPQETSVEQPQEIPVEQPQEPSVEQPQEIPVEQPQEPSVEQPQEPSVEQPQEPSVEQPQEIPVEQPQEPSVEQPQEIPVEQPTDAQEIKPEELSIITPVEKIDNIITSNENDKNIQSNTIYNSTNNTNINAINK